MTGLLIVLLVTVAGYASANAQTPPAQPPAQAAPPAAPKRPDCSAPERRQFDFWLGKWSVTAAGKPAGTSHIESVMKGCGILEHWTSAGGGNGTSLNFYRIAARRPGRRRGSTKAATRCTCRARSRMARWCWRARHGRPTPASTCSGSRGRRTPTQRCGRCGNRRPTAARRGRSPSTGSTRRDRSRRRRSDYSSRRVRIRTSVRCSRADRRSRGTGGVVMRSRAAARSRAPVAVSSSTLTRRSSADATRRTARFEPVHQPGDVRRVAGEGLGQPPHRDRPARLDEVQDVTLRRRELRLGGQRRGWRAGRRRTGPAAARRRRRAVGAWGTWVDLQYADAV